jgi:hypothetical protein
MSVFTTPEATPSRIAGVFRYLFKCKDRKEYRDRLERMLSPGNLQREPGSGGMIKNVINECIKMGLTTVIEENDRQQICLNETKCSTSQDRFDINSFRSLMGRLLMDVDNDANYDLCKLLAWFLAQDVYEIQGDQTGLESALREQVGDERLGLTNDVRYGNFRYWAVFLGFAWEYHNRMMGTTQIVPDPTTYLENQLAELFVDDEGNDVPLPRFMSQVSILCPILEDGFFYDKVAKWLPKRDIDHLCTAISLALLRLVDKQRIMLKSLSDAPVKLIMDGSKPLRYTHISLNRASKGVK